MQQTRNRIAENNGLQGPVAELIFDRSDPIEIAGMDGIVHSGFLLCRIDPERSRSIQKASSVHIDLHGRGRTFGQRRVQQHRSFSYPTLEPIPSVIFRRICRVVEPHVKIGSQESFGRMLPDELLQIGRLHPFVFLKVIDPFDPDVVLHQQIARLRDMLCRAARCQPYGKAHPKRSLHRSNDTSDRFSDSVPILFTLC